MPLAVVVPAGGATAIHWVQGNHLGTPVAITDASGAVVTPSGYSMPGFPGQVRQHAELYYNYHRDYDVSLGRYVQADPIGLAGGPNAYLYAEANPLTRVDPDGQLVWCLTPLGMAVCGAAVELLVQAASNYLNGRDPLDPDCYEWGEVAFAGATGAFGGRWVKSWVRLTPGSMKFKNVSRRIRNKEGLVGKPIDLHHWLIPRRFEDAMGGKLAPIVNHPWNLNPIARTMHHDLHKMNGLSQRLVGAPRDVQLAAGLAAAGAAVEFTGGGLDD